MTTNQAKAPISAHPLFPAVVAIWFAVLLGLGCVVLPTAMFERIVIFSGLPALFPAAAPPLGFTARIVFSLTAAVAGAAAGFILARRLATVHYVDQPEPAFAKLTPKSNTRGPARRPISVLEELGDTKLDPADFMEAAPQSAPIPGRRRSLALTEDTQPDNVFNAAPLPGGEPEWMRPAVDHPVIEEHAEFSSDLQEAAAPAPFAEPEYFSAREFAEIENRVPFAHAPFAQPLGDEGDAPLDFGPPRFAVSEDRDDLSLPPEPAPEPETQREPAAQTFHPAPPATPPVLPTDLDADLGTLGIVQLAERLGHSLQQRDLRRANASDFAARLSGASTLDILGDSDFPADAIPAPGAAIFGQAAFAPPAPDAPAIPAALRPLPVDFDAFDDDGDEDSHLASLSLPLAGLSPATAPEGEYEDEDEIEDIGDGEENYSSLLAMTHPARLSAEFARPGEAEDAEAQTEAPSAAMDNASVAAVQPEARPDLVETDRALRSALAVLQRMSGAA